MNLTCLRRKETDVFINSNNVCFDSVKDVLFYICVSF